MDETKSVINGTDSETSENIANEPLENTAKEEAENVTESVQENESVNAAEMKTENAANETAEQAADKTAGPDAVKVEGGEVKEHKLTAKEKKLQKKAAKKEKKLQKKAAKKERRKLWKQAKKDNRKNLKERYKYAPWFIRIPRVYLLKPLGVILFWGVIAVIVLGIASLIGFMIYLNSITDLLARKDDPVDKELIYAQSPLDEEGAKRIAQFPDIGEDETWTICIYMVGADLEDCDEDDLSITTYYETLNEKKEREEAITQNRIELLNRYSDELKTNSLPLPEFLYYPVRPQSTYTQYYGEEVVRTDTPGSASEDIEEMILSDIPDNVTICLQTGGATRWSNSFINPNKTQRFEIKNDSFEEVDNQPLMRSNDPETLADFLRFCDESYPSDHRMLILWDHGGGPFGYGHDSIFGGRMMSLKEIREGLDMVYDSSESNPAFDIIGFDACLMSTIEVTHSLNGFADFYVLSEETEPAYGYNYTGFFEIMNENPSMSPAAVAQAIADSYTDYYMTQNVNIGEKLFYQDVTFSVVDAKKAEELYQAYGELAKQQLIDSADDISVLAEIGRCSEKSTHYAASDYTIYNLVDLGNYVDYMVDTYPEECSKISELIEEAILYHRENGSLSDSKGISVYIPGSIDSYWGLNYFLQYEYEICEDENVRALYFYKMSGCLNDEMKEYIKAYTDAEPTVLELSSFNRFEKEEPKITDDEFYFSVDENLMKMIQSYSFSVCSYDESLDTIVYYGEDDYAYLDGEGNLRCDFDGQWICLDGEPLSVEITSSTPSSIEYRSRVLYNDTESYLVFAYNRDSEEFSIKGIRDIPDNSPDGINSFINTKGNIELSVGDTIVPLYETSNFSYGTSYDKEGEKIKYRASSSITEKALPSGYYLGMISISDQRGDQYFSKVVGLDISGGKVKDREMNEDFIGTAY